MPPESRTAFDFSTDDLVSYTGLPASYWYNHAAEVGYTKIARKFFWSKEDVDAYLAKHRVPANAAAGAAE